MKTGDLITGRVILRARFLTNEKTKYLGELLCRCGWKNASGYQVIPQKTYVAEM
jgi:hypothetical protein